MNETMDVAVIGGGAAGLSGALTLARARRSVVVFDAGRPRNAPAEGVHGFLTRDGVSPAELVALGRVEVEKYGGQVIDTTVFSVSGRSGEFSISTGSGEFRARRVLVTTGVADELPDIPGLAGRWGRDAVHCPYCHGHEVADRAIGVIGGPLGVHQAQLFRQWSRDVRLFRHDGPELRPTEREQLTARGIEVIEGEIREVAVESDRIVGVRLADGSIAPCEVLTVGSRVEPNVSMLEGLGVRMVDHPSGAGRMVESDFLGLTSVAGIYVGGNVADPMAQVIHAAAAAVRGAAAINADLIAEEVMDAVALAY